MLIQIVVRKRLSLRQNEHIEVLFSTLLSQCDKIGKDIVESSSYQSTDTYSSQQSLLISTLYTTGFQTFLRTGTISLSEIGSVQWQIKVEVSLKSTDTLLADASPVNA